MDQDGFNNWVKLNSVLLNVLPSLVDVTGGYRKVREAYYSKQPGRKPFNYVPNAIQDPMILIVLAQYQSIGEDWEGTAADGASDALISRPWDVLKKVMKLLQDDEFIPTDFVYIPFEDLVMRVRNGIILEVDNDQGWNSISIATYVVNTVNGPSPDQGLTSLLRRLTVSNEPAKNPNAEILQAFRAYLRKNNGLSYDTLQQRFLATIPDEVQQVLVSKVIQEFGPQLFKLARIVTVQPSGLSLDSDIREWLIKADIKTMSGGDEINERFIKDCPQYKEVMADGSRMNKEVIDILTVTLKYKQNLLEGNAEVLIRIAFSIIDKWMNWRKPEPEVVIDTLYTELTSDYPVFLTEIPDVLKDVFTRYVLEYRKQAPGTPESLEGIIRKWYVAKNPKETQVSDLCDLFLIDYPLGRVPEENRITICSEIARVFQLIVQDQLIQEK